MKFYRNMHEFVYFRELDTYWQEIRNEYADSLLSEQLFMFVNLAPSHLAISQDVVDAYLKCHYDTTSDRVVDTYLEHYYVDEDE